MSIQYTFDSKRNIVAQPRTKPKSCSNACYDEVYASSNPDECSNCLFSTIDLSCLEDLKIKGQLKIVNPGFDYGVFQFKELIQSVGAMNYGEENVHSQGARLRPQTKEEIMLIRLQISDELHTIINPFKGREVKFTFRPLTSGASEMNELPFTPRTRIRTPPHPRVDEPRTRREEPTLTEEEQIKIAKILSLLDSLKLKPGDIIRNPCTPGERLGFTPLQVQRSHPHAIPTPLRFGAPGDGASASGFSAGQGASASSASEGGQITPFREINNIILSNLIKPLSNIKDDLPSEFCRENLFNNILPDVEEPLQNPDAYLCYFNSVLHFMYPILLDIQRNTNNDKRLMFLQTKRLENIHIDFLNIVDYIITTLQTSNITNSHKMVENIRANFLNYIIEFNKSNNLYTVRRSTLQRNQQYEGEGKSRKVVSSNTRNEFQTIIEGNQRIWAYQDPLNALNRILDNIMTLAYCTQYSFSNFIKCDYTYCAEEKIYQVNLRYSTLEINPIKPNYDIGELVKLSIQTSELEQFTSESGNPLYKQNLFFNVYNGLFPNFIILKIQEFGELNNYVPANLSNINIIGHSYRITDFVCATGSGGGHYVSYNLRTTNGSEKWFYFNDVAANKREEVPNPLKNMNSQYISMILLRKVIN